MKQTHRCVFISLSLCATFLLASCGNRTNTSTTTYTTPDGLKITPEAVEIDRTAKMMDIRFWKFGVDVPKSGQGINCNIAVLKNGKIFKTLAGGGIGLMKTDTHSEIEVGLYPLAGSITEPGKIRASCWIGGMGSSGFAKNPFAGAKGIIAGDPILLPDGSLELLAGGKVPTWPPIADNFVLVCKFTAMSPMHVK